MRRWPLIPLSVALLALGLLSSCGGGNGSNPTNSDMLSLMTGGGAVPWNSSVSYGSLSYGGQTYKTVKIGTQTWMAENLNVKADSSWCYENSADMCSKYGRLYKWAAVMGLDASYNSKVWNGTLPRQGICPSGWHVPSDAEWTILANYVGGSSTAGTKLKSTSGWYVPQAATDVYGFRATPAGALYGEGSFSSVGIAAYFWSSSEYDAINSWTRSLYSIADSLDREIGYKTEFAYSVRCVEGAGSATSSTVVAPVFSPSAGTYSSAQSVALSSSTSGATIYYTTDGSTPTTSSTKYTSSVTVSASKTLRAIAVMSGSTTSSVSSATYTISGGTSSSAIPWNSSVSYGSLSYGGQTYKTVVIGTQTWMAENLNYKVDSSWCYANSADSCSKYGRLYQWAAAMGLDTSYNSKSWSGTLPRQGICPSGWHVPSDPEWNSLTTYVGGGSTAGAKLKSASGWNPYNGSSSDGTDTYGFRVLPGGDRDSSGKYSYVDYITYFWASSEHVADSAMRSCVFFTSAEVFTLGNNKKTAHSLRCIKD